nr:MarR family transcriptional regulator [uncultured Anaerocolumna sp.]
MEKNVTIGQVNAAIYRNIQMLLSSTLNDLDIKNGQYDFFLVISLWEGLSQKELSEHLHISKSTTAKAVKNLTEKGYVRRQKDERDGRIEHLYLTKKGREKSPFVQSIFQKIIDVSTKGLSQTEITQLLTLMQKVLDNIISENMLLSEKEYENE